MTRALSVVIPVRNSSTTLARALTAVLASDLPRESFEIIVVDDASSDRSAAIAARYADMVVRLKGAPSGPAYARNRGTELARGAMVAFVDPDVIVTPETFGRMLAALADQPEIAAISASRDDLVGAPNFVSQYWNLLLRYCEQRNAGAQAHLSSECCVVRRSVFLSAGMFDEWRFEAASLESLELGQRLQREGNQLLLSSDIQVTHFKRWTVPSVLREVWKRSQLLTRSLGYQRTRAVAPSEVVFTLSSALAPTIGFVGTQTLVAAFVPRPLIAAEVMIVLIMVLLANFRLQRFNAAVRGPFFAIAAAPLQILVEMTSALALVTGWFLHNTVGDRVPGATTQAFAEVGLEVWPPVPRRR